MSQTLQCPKCRRETLKRVDSYTASGDLSSRPARCERCGGLWLTREELEAVEKEPGAVVLPVDDPPAKTPRADDDRGEIDDVETTSDGTPTPRTEPEPAGPPREDRDEVRVVEAAGPTREELPDGETEDDEVAVDRAAEASAAGASEEIEYVGDADPAAPDDRAREITRIAEFPEGADARGGLCPDCHRILVRADVELEETFYLERCSHCGGIWFDAGEWKLLTEHEELRHDLSRLWDPHYRRERLERQNREAYLERLKQQLGADLYEQIESVAAELDDHDHKGAGVAFLFERLGIPHPEWDEKPVAHEASVEVEELGDLD